MTATVQDNKAKPATPALEQTSADALAQLNAVFAAYNQTTSRMQESYGLLQQEVVRLREELGRKNEQLQRKNRLAALGEMAAGMAHEIRNPLGAIQLYLSILDRDLRDQPEPIQWVHKISKAVQSLDLIVNDILAFTHEQVCDKTRVEVAALVREVVDYVEPQVRQRRIVMDTDGVDENLTSQLDANMMRRALLNLVLNAVEAVEDGGAVYISAQAGAEEETGRLRIVIADTGPGIPEEIRDRIFNPFFTTKDTGTGLGLAIVHRLIECHGGAISVTNRTPHGAVFTISVG